MSAFLGPIHYWMYNKIQIQQELIDGVIELSIKKEMNISLQEELENKYGITESRPLEEVIEQDNIHGWLQTLVSTVEYKLAYSVSLILNKRPELMEQLENYFRQKGAEQGANLENPSSPADVYKGINDALLDGMPCDHANSIAQESDTELVWKRNACVHQNYWDKVGGDIANYYRLKEAFLNGYAEASGMNFIKIDEITYKIARSESYE